MDVQKLKQLGIKPGPVYAQIKAGLKVKMDNGEVINPEEFLGPPKKGRKVTILGDTKDSSKMLSICQDSDVSFMKLQMKIRLKHKQLNMDIPLRIWLHNLLWRLNLVYCV